MKPRNEAEKIAESKRVEGALAGISSSMPADLKVEALTALIAAAETTTATVKSLTSDRAAAVDAKSKAFAALDDFLKRARFGAKAVFGDDSLEYERLGGKRLSERKRPSRKVETSVGVEA